ncbi:MAG: hypothetical protein ACOYIO_03975 [Eubacteriales bacterium]|jgi:hypothetical protein|nr:hypothetical protein [Eubacteriales bacterium]
MKEPLRKVWLDPIEYGLIVKALHRFRTDLISEESPTEDVDDLLIKIIDTPVKNRSVELDAR